MTATTFIQKIPEVFEKLHMPTLVRGDRDRLNVFFYGCLGNFMYTPVMTQVDYLNTLGLQYPSHDIDGSIVSIEQGSCCYNP